MTQALEQFLALSANQQERYSDYVNLVKAIVAQQKLLVAANEEIVASARNAFNCDTLTGKEFVYTRPRKWGSIPEVPSTLQNNSSFFNDNGKIPAYYSHVQLVNNQEMKRIILDYFPDFEFKNEFYQKDKYLVLAAFGGEDYEESLLDDPRKSFYEMMVIAV